MAALKKVRQKLGRPAKPPKEKLIGYGGTMHPNALAKVDALAREYNVSRSMMIAELVRIGMNHQKQIKFAE